MIETDIQDIKTSMQQVYDDSDCLFSAAQVDQAIARLGDEISHSLSDRNPIILTVMNGGLVFAGQLLPRLNFPLQLDYVHATRYLDQETGDKLQWKVSPSILMAGRDVLLIDDILDQGHTLLEIQKYCKQQKANEVKIAVLLDKLHDRKASIDFRADFVGMEVEDRFVFGFGMDYKGYWRNAPGIYAVKGL